jgi:F-type H+-transporting ATPase subunit a
MILANAVGGHFGLHEWCLIWSSAVVVLVILGTAVAARSQTGLVPKGVAAVYEHMFDWMEGIAIGFMGKEGRNYVPLALSFFLYILIANWLGLLPWPVFGHGEHGIPLYESPTASISTTLALAILSFLAFNLLGLKKRVFPPQHHHHHHHDEHGAHEHEHEHEHHHAPGGLMGLWQWISHFWQPAPKLWSEFSGGLRLIVVALFFLFLGLNFIEEFARIMSLSLRLYGNISGEHAAKVNMIMIIEQMMAQGGLTGYGVAAVVFGASCFVTILGALAGFVQAMVFSMLTLSYIAHAVADDH